MHNLVSLLEYWSYVPLSKLGFPVLGDGQEVH